MMLIPYLILTVGFILMAILDHHNGSTPDGWLIGAISGLAAGILSSK